MFDKLIESDSHGAEFKNRGRYFAISTFVMTILCLTGVLVGIYAADFGLGANNLEFSQLIAPVDLTEPEPDQPKQSPHQNQSVNNSLERPMRQAAVQNIVEIPNSILPISSVPSNKWERQPYEQIDQGPINADPSGGSGKHVEGNKNSGLLEPELEETTSKPTNKPPPINEKPAPKKNIVISLGVITGKAKSLPHPPYPPVAKQLGIAGIVTVQITIDLDGSVISSHAVDGPQLLRREAELAAMRAKFAPTLLSNQPVKATGIITYNFKKS